MSLISLGALKLGGLAVNPELKRALKSLADAVAGRPGAPDGPTRGPLRAGSAPHSEPEAHGKADNKGLLFPALLAGLLATFTTQLLAWWFFPVTVWWQADSRWPGIIAGVVALQVGTFAANRVLSAPKKGTP
jgi:hypothetical protein